jgi:hypothetical protein
MNQEGQAGRDLTQVGGNLTQKLFDLNLSKRNLSQVYVHGQDNSWLSACLSQWDRLEKERVAITVASIKDAYAVSYHRFKGRVNGKLIFVLLLIVLFMLIHNPDTTVLIDKGEYITYRTYCGLVHSRWDLVVCPTNSKDIKRVSSSQSENIALAKDNATKEAFEVYRKTWYRHLLFWALFPFLLTVLLTLILDELVLSISSVIYRQKRRARTRIARILFTLLDSHEKECVEKTLSFRFYETLRDIKNDDIDD